MKRVNRDTVDRRLKWTSWSCMAAGMAIGLAVLLGRGSFGTHAGESAPEQVPLAAASLAASASQQPTTALTKIKDVRLGQRVAGRNPDRSEVDDSLPDPVASQWRHLSLRMAKENGDELSIELLRPLEWIEFYGAAPGQTIDLDLAEMGAEGSAEVLSVSPCPPIQSGAGNVVTGTFAHRSSGDLINLHIAGEPEPIGVTRNHRFWSEDRQQFVEAGELEPDETLLTPSGATTSVTAIAPRSADEAVFDLEVHQEHAYLVAYCGIVAHNNYDGDALKGRVTGLSEIRQKALAAKYGDLSARYEIEAAKELRAQGRNVHFQTPTGQRGPTTADFLVDGGPFDVYTPVTKTPDNIIKGKNQSPNIILHLRHTTVTLEELGGVPEILRRVNNFHPDFPGRIQTVEVIR